MAKEWARKFYSNSKWQKCRQSYIAERITVDGGLCEKCNEELGYVVHHEIALTPENMFSDTAYNHELMKYLCKRCHDKEDGHFKPIDSDAEQGRKYVFDDAGQLVGIG